MVVDQGVEAIGAAVPEVPDKGAVVEELGVLLEELVAQPVFEGFGFAALEPGGGDEGAFVEGAEGRSEELTQAGGGGLLAVERREADDAVFVGEGFQPVGAEGGAIGEAAAGLARPAVAEQAGHGDVERLGGALRMAVEEPLRRVVAVRLGQAVWVFLGGDFLPVGEVEGDFDKVCIRNLQLLIEFVLTSLKSRRGTKAQIAGRMSCLFAEQ